MPFGDDGCRESEHEDVDCIACFGHDREIPTHMALWKAHSQQDTHI